VYYIYYTLHTIISLFFKVFCMYYTGFLQAFIDIKIEVLIKE